MNSIFILKTIFTIFHKVILFILNFIAIFTQGLFVERNISYNSLLALSIFLTKIDVKI